MQSNSSSLKAKSIDIVIFCLYNWAAFFREIRKQQSVSFFYLFYQYTVSYFSSMNHILIDFYILSFIQFRKSLLSCKSASQNLADIYNYSFFFQHCLILTFHLISWILSYFYSYFCCEIWIYFCFQKFQLWEYCWISCSCFYFYNWLFWQWVDSWFDFNQFCWFCFYFNLSIHSFSFEWMLTVSCEAHWWINYWYIIHLIHILLFWVSQEYHENLQCNFIYYCCRCSSK